MAQQHFLTTEAVRMRSRDEREARKRISVGAGMNQVSPVGYWYKHGRYRSDDEARGAFDLAHQQYLDGLGETAAQWMGLTADEFNAWYADGTLPPRTK